jgi:hypothetical protein
MPSRELAPVELVREFWGLWSNEGFDELLARYDEFFTADLEWHSPVAAVAGRHHRGRAGLERHLAELDEGFRGIRADPQAIAEIAPDVVRSDVLIHGEGPSSGLTVDSPLVCFARLRDGRICWNWASFDLAVAERVGDALVLGETVEA